MGSTIVRTTVGFDFHDHSRNALTVNGGDDEQFPKQITSDREDVRTCIKIPRQFHRYRNLQIITTKITSPITTIPLRTQVCPTRTAILAPK